MLKKTSINPFLGLIIFLGLCFCLLMNCSCEASNGNNNSPPSKDTEHPNVPTKPMIIWFQDIETGPEVLRLAVSSGIFSHVILEGVNPLDRPDYYKVTKFRKALEVLREYKDVKIIWCRWLYPGHKLDNFKLEDAFDAQYYVRQIRQIRKEAKLMGADFVALDAEPYVKCPLKSFPSRRIPEDKFNEMRDAIRTAVEAEGKVDFVLPAPFIFIGRLKHLYEATSEVGKIVIAEHTFRDVPRRRNDNRRPYDIFGAYVSVEKRDPKNPIMPYFTPREILARQELWSHKKGLFIFPGPPGHSENPMLVAREFAQIKTIRSTQDGKSEH